MRAALLIASLWTALAAGTAEPIRVGYVNGLTGPFAGTVLTSLKAVRLAVEQWNARGGIAGRPLELQTFDTNADPLRIPLVMEQVAESGVVAVLGFHMSNDALLAAPIADKKRLPMVVAGATHPGITQGRRFVIRVCWDDDDQGRFSAHFARHELKAKRVAVIRDAADSYTLYLASVFRRHARAEGIDLIADYPIRTGERDFHRIVSSLRLLSPRPDLLYMPVSSVEAGYFIPQMLAAKLSIPLLGCDSWQNADFYKTLSSLGSLNFDAFFVGHWHRDLPFARSRDFVRTYEARFHETLTTLDGDAALAFDAAEVLFSTMASHPAARGKALAKALHSVKWHGATGSIAIGASGDPIKPVLPLVFSRGKIAPWRR